MPHRPEDIIAACEAAFPTWHSDCSGFAKAVATALDIMLAGNADEIMAHLRANWSSLADGPAAATAAESGAFVIGGLASGQLAHPNPHGHLVIVVSGPLVRNAFPMAYWGQLGGEGARNKSINWAFNKLDLPNVTFHAPPV